MSAEQCQVSHRDDRLESQNVFWHWQFLPLPTSNSVDQEPRKGGFGKGGFCRVQCHGQGKKKFPRILAPTVHLALRAPQPREAYILQKPPSKKNLFLVPDAANLSGQNVCWNGKHPDNTSPP